MLSLDIILTQSQRSLIPDQLFGRDSVALCCVQDKRLRSGDLILRIGDTDLAGMGSEQVAQVLKQTSARVRLLIARDTAGNDLSHPVTQQRETRPAQVHKVRVY